MQVEAQPWIYDSEAAIDRNDVKARRTRRPRKTIDSVVRYAPARSSNWYTRSQ